MRAVAAALLAEMSPVQLRRIELLMEKQAPSLWRTSFITSRWDVARYLAEADSWLRLEYTGGRAPVARRLGLEEFDYGVYQGWAPAHEVRDRYEHRI